LTPLLYALTFLLEIFAPDVKMKFKKKYNLATRRYGSKDAPPINSPLNGG